MPRQTRAAQSSPDNTTPAHDELGLRLARREKPPYLAKIVKKSPQTKKNLETLISSPNAIARLPQHRCDNCRDEDKTCITFMLGRACFYCVYRRKSCSAVGERAPESERASRVVRSRREGAASRRVEKRTASKSRTRQSKEDQAGSRGESIEDEDETSSTTQSTRSRQRQTNRSSASLREDTAGALVDGRMSLQALEESVATAVIHDLRMERAVKAVPARSIALRRALEAAADGDEQQARQSLEEALAQTRSARDAMKAVYLALEAEEVRIAEQLGI